ncbi:MAG: BppU family phage baseplate upper protein [Clostridium sp.]|uniref:BppU family phage baseplate upper protein n=1 Tax=Clostridium sp. TaxID=1506 RepID=UPI003F3A437E
MEYIKPKFVDIDKDEMIELEAIEHDTKTRFINFKFMGGNKLIDLTDCKVRIYANNSKYQEVFNDLSVLDSKKGLAQLELTDGLLSLGTTEYQLKIMPIGGGQLSSNVMRLIVKKDLMSNNAIEGSNEYTALENAIKEVDSLIKHGTNTNSSLSENIKTGNALVDTLISKLTLANTTTDNLDKSTSNANTGKNNLDESIRSGSSTNSNLTTNINIAKDVIQQLITNSEGFLKLLDFEYKLIQNGGYLKFPFGLLLQWGNEESVPLTGGRIVTLPIQFKNADYLVFTNCHDGPNKTPETKVYYIREGNFSIQVFADLMNVFWFAIGWE